MIYEFRCDYCASRFDRSLSVDERDEPQECDYCGSETERVFTPATVLVPEAFGYDRSLLGQSYEQAKAQDRENELYLNSRPRTPPKPDFDTLVKDELRRAGWPRT